MPKVNDKEKILKAAREKQLVSYKGATIRLSADWIRNTEDGIVKYTVLEQQQEKKIQIYEDSLMGLW